MKILNSDSTKKVLVMWSGGLDSTYGLVRLLKETEYEIHAVHINRMALDDSGNYQTSTCEYENEAVSNLYEKLIADFRPFKLHYSAVNLTNFNTFARDTSTALFLGAQIALQNKFTSKDLILFSFNSDEDKNWNPESSLYVFLRANAIRILKACWGKECVPHCFLWSPVPSKEEEVHYLPLEIFQMTASCRKPDKDGNSFSSCGVCPECITLSSIVHPDEK